MRITEFLAWKVFLPSLTQFTAPPDSVFPKVGSFRKIYIYRKAQKSASKDLQPLVTWKVSVKIVSMSQPITQQWMRRRGAGAVTEFLNFLAAAQGDHRTQQARRTRRCLGRGAHCMCPYMD